MSIQKVIENIRQVSRSNDVAVNCPVWFWNRIMLYMKFHTKFGDNRLKWESYRRGKKKLIRRI